MVRIALIGPESTGKSTLCGALATHFGFSLVNEYARDYLDKIGRAYTLNDVLLIYRNQYSTEQGLISSNPRGMFVDTEFINGKVWCEEKFGASPDWFTQMIQNHPYDLYLLTTPDLSWEPDPLRENPDKADYFFLRYKQQLEFYKLNYATIGGVGEQRLKAAIDAVELLLQKKVQ